MIDYCLQKRKICAKIFSHFLKVESIIADEILSTSLELKVRLINELNSLGKSSRNVTRHNEHTHFNAEAYSSEGLFGCKFAATYFTLFQETEKIGANL